MISKYFQNFLDENGLELNERFTLVDTDGNPMFIGCEFWIDTQHKGRLACNNKNIATTDIVISMFRGNLLVKQEPYKPQKGDSYYYVKANGEVGTGIFTGWTLDYLIRNSGNCYRTYAEADLNIEQNLKDHFGDE